MRWRGSNQLRTFRELHQIFTVTAFAKRELLADIVTRAHNECDVSVVDEFQNYRVPLIDN